MGVFIGTLTTPCDIGLHDHVSDVGQRPKTRIEDAYATVDVGPKLLWQFLFRVQAVLQDSVGGRRDRIKTS